MKISTLYYTKKSTMKNQKQIEETITNAVDKLNIAVQSLATILEEQNLLSPLSKVVSIKNENENRLIVVEDIIAIKVNDHLCDFFIENSCKFSCIYKLSDIELMLPDYFCRVSRSSIINTKKIVSFCAKSKEIRLISNLYVTYSPDKIPILKQHLEKNFSIIKL
jgi:DNA-binding LytR/AlgR family response regulator